MHARRWIGTGNGRQLFRNCRAAAPITLGKKIADHAPPPRSLPETASLRTISSLLVASPCPPRSACESTTENKYVGNFCLCGILIPVHEIGVIGQHKDARSRKGFQSYEFEIRITNFSYISIIELPNRSTRMLNKHAKSPRTQITTLSFGGA